MLSQIKSWQNVMETFVIHWKNIFQHTTCWDFRDVNYKSIKKHFVSHRPRDPWLPVIKTEIKTSPEYHEEKNLQWDFTTWFHITFWMFNIHALQRSNLVLTTAETDCNIHYEDLCRTDGQLKITNDFQLSFESDGVRLNWLLRLHPEKKTRRAWKVYLEEARSLMDLCHQLLKIFKLWWYLPSSFYLHMYVLTSTVEKSYLYNKNI